MTREMLKSRDCIKNSLVGFTAPNLQGDHSTWGKSWLMLSRAMSSWYSQEHWGVGHLLD